MSYRLVLPEDWEDYSWQANAKEYYPDAVVELPDGRRKGLFFTTLARLIGDATSELDCGHPCFYERGIVVVPEITREAMERAVEFIARAREGWFSD